MRPRVTRDENGNIEWMLTGICDSTWGLDKFDGKSITGYILYFMKVAISWKSKAQSHVTLSSCQAEYVS